MEILNSDKEGIKKAAKIITSGEIIFIPTDTVYGIAANPYNNKAIKKLFSIKKRSINNSLILLCSNYKMAKKYAFFNKIAEKLKKKFWPGPLTLILKKKPKSKIASLVSNKSLWVGCRIPSNKIALKLLNSIDFPIAAPSANINTKT